jgi:hypothetical protein
MFTKRDKDGKRYQDTIPALKVASVNSRAVDLAWLITSKIRTDLNDALFYQISKAEVDNLTSEIVYEGKDRICSVADLKPLTKYIFKLRVGQKYGTNDIDWSKEYTTIEIATPDETSIGKASNKLMKAITEGDVDAGTFIN